MSDDDKTTTMTFRTSPAVKAKIDQLAKKLNDQYWKIDWSSPYRNCTTKSGLIHELLSGTVTMSGLEEKVQEMQKLQEQS